MDVFLESLNKKIDEIESKIQKIRYIQEFDKAIEFEKVFQTIKEKIKAMQDVEHQTHLYYYEAMDALQVIDFEIDDYMEVEGNIKEHELNRTIFLEKLKHFIDDSKGKTSEQVLEDLTCMVQEIRELELETNLFSELYSLTAQTCLNIFINQAKNGDLINLGLVNIVSTEKAFAKEIQNQLNLMAEDQKEDKVAAYNILKLCQTVNEKTIGNLNIWQTLSGKKEVNIKQLEPKISEIIQEKQLISLESNKKTIIDKLRDKFGKKSGTTLYTFGKLNKETGKYENIKIEQHSFPPKGIFLLRKCLTECIYLEINDIDVVDISSIESIFPQLHSLSFGRNVHEIKRSTLKDNLESLKNLEKINISNDVEILGENSFANCVGIADVKFGDSIEEIGNSCFFGCNKLENVNLPNNLSKLGESAFGNCKNLQTVNLSENLCKIGSYAFQGCANLQAINFPSNLSEIGKFAFDGCSKLKIVNLPKNLYKLGFASLYSLKNTLDSIVHLPQNLYDLYKCIQAFNSRSLY